MDEIVALLHILFMISVACCSIYTAKQSFYKYVLRGEKNIHTYIYIYIYIFEINVSSVKESLNKNYEKIIR